MEVTEEDLRAAVLRPLLSYRTLGRGAGAQVTDYPTIETDVLRKKNGPADNFDGGNLNKSAEFTRLLSSTSFIDNEPPSFHTPSDSLCSTESTARSTIMSSSPGSTVHSLLEADGVVGCRPTARLLPSLVVERIFAFVRNPSRACGAVCRQWRRIAGRARGGQQQGSTAPPPLSSSIRRGPFRTVSREPASAANTVRPAVSIPLSKQPTALAVLPLGASETSLSLVLVGDAMGEVSCRPSNAADRVLFTLSSAEGAPAAAQEPIKNLHVCDRGRARWVIVTAPSAVDVYAFGKISTFALGPKAAAALDGLKPVFVRRIPTVRASAMLCHASQPFIATAAPGGLVEVWRATAAGGPVAEVRQHSMVVSCMAPSPFAERGSGAGAHGSFFTAGRDGLLCHVAWPGGGAGGALCLAKIQAAGPGGHIGPVAFMAASIAARCLATVCSGGMLVIRTAAADGTVAVAKKRHLPLFSCPPRCMSVGERSGVIGGADGALLSFSLAEASTPSLPTTRLSGHTEAVTMVAQSGDHVASCSSSGKVLLWNASTSFVSSPADLAGAEAVGYPTWAPAPSQSPAACMALAPARQKDVPSGAAPWKQIFLGCRNRTLASVVM